MGKSPKYSPYNPQFIAPLEHRSWPSKQLTKAPLWCSVDLRDGNQALINPMGVAQKLELFHLLCEIGFKEIEIGFPSASETEFAFARELLQVGIPKQVTPQVLTQAREHLIKKTFAALQGYPRSIVHLYNSTSELQRRVVFRADKKEILALAVQGTKLVKSFAADHDGEIVFQYSPESFTGTEPQFALEVCKAVIECWQPSAQNKMIINLPATVEMAAPNVYADQIEWFHQMLPHREAIILSLHTHNDRGTGIAATELGLLAGADRVEGTLFGNGERTGNLDIVTVALNLLSQGIDPELNFSQLPRIRAVCERLTELPVGARHPYAGDLVFTAFSGSHQDAINKGFRALEQSGDTAWEVPYLPIDPKDLGRSYEAIIRINSQSGKGGVAYILAQEFGIELPKEFQPALAAAVQKVSDELGRELSAPVIWQIFNEQFLNREQPFSLLSLQSETQGAEGSDVHVVVELLHGDQQKRVTGKGNGPLSACARALVAAGAPEFDITSFSQHARTQGKEADAVAYIQVTNSEGKSAFGAGLHSSIERASVKALFSAVNKLIRAG